MHSNARRDYDACMRTHARQLLFGLIILFFTGGIASGTSAQVEVRDVSVNASVASIPSIDSGGGASGSAPRSGVRFSGLAYPRAPVTLLLASGVAATTTADITGRFTLLFTDVRDADRLFFSLYATDTAGRRSTLLNFPVALYTGELTDISGIRFPPTIASDKSAMRQHEYLTIDGAALPALPLEVLIQGAAQKVFTLLSGEQGSYRLTVPVALAPGEYLLRTRYENDSRTSAVLRLVIGPITAPGETTTNIPGDCNLDQRVTLVDFSVLAYWFGKQNPPQCVDTNADGVVNLVDFSILAFYWKG